MPPSPTPTVKRIHCPGMYFRELPFADMRADASACWSMAMATCNGAPAFPTLEVIAKIEAMLYRAWTDGHTRGVFDSREKQSPAAPGASHG